MVCRSAVRTIERVSEQKRGESTEIQREDSPRKMPQYVLRNFLGRGVDITRFAPNKISTSIQHSFLVEPDATLVHITPQVEEYYSTHELTRQCTEQIRSELHTLFSRPFFLDPVKVGLEVSIGWGTSKTTGEELTRSVEKIHKCTASFRPDFWECLPFALDENYTLRGHVEDNTEIRAKIAATVKCNKLQASLDFYGRERTMGMLVTKKKACEKLLQSPHTRATHFISAVHLGAMVINESSAKQNKRTPSKSNFEATIKTHAQIEQSPPDKGDETKNDSQRNEEECKKDQVFFRDPGVKLQGPHTIIEDGQERIIGYELLPIIALVREEWKEDLRKVCDEYIYQSLQQQQGRNSDNGIVI